MQARRSRSPWRGGRRQRAQREVEPVTPRSPVARRGGRSRGAGPRRPRRSGPRGGRRDEDERPRDQSHAEEQHQELAHVDDHGARTLRVRGRQRCLPRAAGDDGDVHVLVALAPGRRCPSTTALIVRSSRRARRTTRRSARRPRRRGRWRHEGEIAHGVARPRPGPRADRPRTYPTAVTAVPAARSSCAGRVARSARSSPS